MKKILIIIAFILFFLSNLIVAQEQQVEHKRLDFLLGKWKSVSINHKTGEEASGSSTIRWIMDEKWLQWKFTIQLKQGPLEVLTLINYLKEKNKYAFYSFNPVDNEQIPHYGNWINDSTLRIETDFQGVKVRVDFSTEENGDFYQEHSRANSEGQRIVTSRTKYSRKVEEDSDLNLYYLNHSLPKTTPVIFAPGLVKNCPSISPDMKEFYFRGHDQSGILCMILEKDKWSNPQLISFSDKRFNYVNPHLSPDGNTIVFASNQPPNKSGNPNEHFDNYYSERNSNGWGEAKSFGDMINSKKTDGHPTISTSGNLYFFSDREGGKGGCDLYISNFTNGSYSKPKNLGSSINTEKHESDPFIAPNESYLIYCVRDRDDGYGKNDLYISFRKIYNSWTNPINMGGIINTKAEELFPGVSPDGKYFFFSSTKSGRMDVYWVDAGIIEELKFKME